jgi:hypothetical protein
MKISTFGEFKFFLENNKLENYNSEIADFIGCVSIYRTICSCKKNLKLNRHEECNRIYISIISHISNELKNIFLSCAGDSRIEFYYNTNFPIATLSSSS